MNELQQKQLEVLQAFIKVCEKNNLTYYLCGGTALGAVRHKGFIPWDDDIDVMMPRPDYEKFLTLQKDFDDPKYFIQTWKTDPRYLYNFAKVRDSSTTFVEDHFAHHQINHGVWIDVFPLDGFSYEIKPAPYFTDKVRHVWRQIVLMYPSGYWRKFHANTFFKDLGFNILALLTFWTNIGHWRNKRLDRYAKKIPFKKGVLVGNYFGTNPKKEAMPAEIFGKGSEGVFEGTKVMLPCDIDKYLTLLYRDYMQLPPEDQREGHHHHKGLSLTESYVTYCRKHRL